MNVGHLLEGVLAGTDGDHVRVVVLAGELRRRDAPHQCGADAGDLVRRDLLAVARTAEDDPERVDAGILIPHDRLRGADAEGRIVVQRVVLDRSVIDHLVSVSGEVVLELRRELQSGVVGREWMRMGQS